MPVTMNQSTQTLLNDILAFAGTVQVASESPLKKDGTQLAVQEIVGQLSFQLVGHHSPSGVPNQPCGYKQTAEGAENRFAAMRKKIKVDDKDILVSIENGLRYAADEDKYYDFVHVIVEKGGVKTTHTQDCCEVPKEIVDELDANQDITWAEIAEKKGLVTNTKNPHQAATFGGVSRVEHIRRALNCAFKKIDQQKDNLITCNREANLNDFRSPDRYERRGIVYATAEEEKSQNTIDLYNHGCPLSRWNIDSEIASQNYFKVFPTGDAFSVISSDVNLDQASVNIHVGIEHKNYSPLVLLQEALQLSRCASEKGANKITIVLPEQYHPLLYPNDFNVLLLNLFKVSGAGGVYFYDQLYQGKLAVNTKTLSCNKEPVLNHLQWNAEGVLDEKVAHYMRKHAMDHVFTQCAMNLVDIQKLLSADTAPEKIHVPDIKHPHILLCCSANQPFAKKIAESLAARGETVKIYNVQGQGEKAMIPHDANLCGSTVTIVQSTRPNPEDVAKSREYDINGASAYFFEAIMVARQAHLRGAEQVNFVNPYQFSARSDKAEDAPTIKPSPDKADEIPKGRTGAYVQLNGLILEAAGVNHVITAECHDPHTLSGTYKGKKIHGSEVHALTVISTKIAEEYMRSAHQGELALVTPDAGAAKRTKELTQHLKAILKGKLCDGRILMEKERGSHNDDSAVINNVNLGDIGINAQDKYLITDDETATGGTLCQAIMNLKKKGAEDISVIVVHNNMPLDWLERQLCLARFLVIGVNDLHFSDTQEMGKFAKNYDDLIQTYSNMTSLSAVAIEAKISKWFAKNMKDYGSSLDSIKSMISQISARVNVHCIADDFVDKFSKKKKLQLSLVQNQTSSSFAANTIFSSSNPLSSLVRSNAQIPAVMNQAAGQSNAM